MRLAARTLSRARPLRAALLASLLLTSACHDLSRQRPDLASSDLTLPGLDRPLDLRADRTRDLAAPPDHAPDLPLPRPDKTPKDAPPPPPCVATADSLTLALFTFDVGSGATLLDSTGKHHGFIKGSTITRKAGQKGCGKALNFTGALGKNTNYASIPDHAAWRISTVSLDFWLHLDAPAPSGSQGIITRDAGGGAVGHLSLMYSCGGRFVARVQTATADHVVCSDVSPPGKWRHVGLNIGAPGLKLYVDGKESNYTGTEKLGATCYWSLKCGTSGSTGIAGAKEPWVFGAGSYHSKTGKAEPVYEQMKGSMDSLRISNAHRKFKIP